MTSLIRTEGITKKYVQRSRTGRSKQLLTAVSGISLEIFAGQSLGLIGESGCGKSTLGRTICGLEHSDAGKLFLGDAEVTNLSRNEFRPYRRDVQMVFQNSLAAFDPKYTVGRSVDEVLKNLAGVSRAEAAERKTDIFSRVGLDPKLLDRFPRELSGGERQRANIARAVILKPKVVVCDEPVASLDYSLRKSVLTMLNSLAETDNVTYLFITHDLSTIRYVCSKIAVMYLGEVVEMMDADSIETDMAHPYTKMLFDSILVADPSKRGTIERETESELPELSGKPKSGCAFQDRCKRCIEQCRLQAPVLREIGKEHFVACNNL